MKIQWMFPDSSQALQLLHRPLVLHRRKSYINDRPYIVVRSGDTGWSVVRVTFDEETAEEQDVIAANILLAAEIRVADFKEKHGVAV